MLVLVLCVVSGVLLAADTDDPGEPEVDLLADFPVLSTSAGTVIPFGQARIFLPDVNLPRQMTGALSKAAVAIAARKIMYHWLIWSLGSADRFLSVDHYKKVLGWYKEGRLDSMLSFGYVLLQFKNFFDISLEVGHEVSNRISNAAGWERVGSLPVYPGKVLDKAVFIDVMLRPNLLEGKMERTLDIIPLKSVDVSDDALTSWQRELASLVNTALQNDIQLIRLSMRDKGAVELEWQSRHAWYGFNYAPLYSAPFTTPELMNWLRFSYGHQEQNSSISTVLSPNALRCIGRKLQGEVFECQPEPASVSRIDSEHLEVSLDQGQGRLHILDNQSPWPGLPGTMVFDDKAGSPRSIINHSNQYRMPRWLAPVADALLYEAAVSAVEPIVDSAFEYSNRWWHGADQYKVLEVLKDTTADIGKVQSRVERVQDAQGKTWIRKTVWDTRNRGFDAVQPSNSFLDLARERSMLNRLQHDNIVKLHDSWIENSGTRNAAMVLIEEDAGDSLMQTEISSVQQFKHVMRGSLSALQAMHKKGIAHFDIKPGNIMVDKNDNVRVGDLGLAMHLDKEGRGLVLGATPDYMAKEVRINGQVPWQADIWSLGVLGLLDGPVEDAPLYDRHTIYDKTESLNDLMNLRLRDYVSSKDDPKNGPGLSDFLGRMMEPDYLKRESYDQLLGHPFLNSYQTGRGYYYGQ